MYYIHKVYYIFIGICFICIQVFYIIHICIYICIYVYVYVYVYVYEDVDVDVFVSG